LEIKLIAGAEGGNDRVDKLKTRYHEGNNIGRYLRNAKRNGLRGCYL
jgi:hypothetical protein